MIQSKKNTKMNPRIHKLNINYQRVKPIDFSSFPDLSDSNSNSVKYNPYAVSNIQYYYPHYKIFFEMNSSNYNQITFNHSQQMTGFNQVSGEIDKSIFIKFAPLLDPLRFLTGKYLQEPNIRCLPKLDSTKEQCFEKLLDIQNSSYVDCFFSFLVSRYKEETGFKHGIDFYGTYLGIQSLFRYNMIDDIEYLRDVTSFQENPDLYEMDADHLEMVLRNQEPIDSDNSRKNRKELIIENETSIDLDVEELSVNESVTSSQTDMNLGDNLLDDLLPTEPLETDENHDEPDEESCNSSSCYESTETEMSDSSSSSSSSSNVSLSGSESCSELYSEEEDPKLFVYLKNFPVQMICQERCIDTLDHLIISRTLKTDEELLSALIQVVMILIVYQRQFQFTHNDLHTCNIMYQDTDDEFLYYNIDGNKYKIPTFGRIYKLIDFGRAIYTYEGVRFCSDSYSKSGDAYSQYNTEPYFNPDKDRVEPNYSFDLCRLACSLYDMVSERYEKSRQLIDTWILDDFGKNVLYKKTGEERYPDFKLYKMISRTVHNHVPLTQLNNPIIAQYKI